MNYFSPHLRSYFIDVFRMGQILIENTVEAVCLFSHKNE